MGVVPFFGIIVVVRRVAVRMCDEMFVCTPLVLVRAERLSESGLTTGPVAGLNVLIDGGRGQSEDGASVFGGERLLGLLASAGEFIPCPAW